MPNLNSVSLMGNLTKAPELRATPKGTSVCAFSLAINESYRDDQGQARQETTYVDVEAWGKQAETIGQHVAKGDPLYVEGKLRNDQWEDKASGQKRTRMKVVLTNFQFLKSKAATGNEASEAPTTPAPGKSAKGK